MKNLFLALIAVIAFSFTAHAQRFGTTSNADNTFRNLTNGVVRITQASGVDTTKFIPNAFHTYVYNATALNDSVALSITSVSKAKLFDAITVVVLSDGTARKVKFVGSNWQATTTSYSLTVSKYSVFRFIFNGTKFVFSGAQNPS